MEEQYNVFLNNSHSSFQEKLLLKYNYNIVANLMNRIKDKKSEIDVLEIGVGKGYFANACFKLANEQSLKLKYSAFDRNKAMLDNLKKTNSKVSTYLGELPNLNIPKTKKFDIIYCAFVIEHLSSGMEVYDVISQSKKLLKKDGIIVFFTPNAMQQRFEFYNIDYTHHYPTTARNINMAFNDANIMNVECLKINGLCTYKRFDNTLIRITHKFIFYFYSYHLFSAIFKPFYRVPLYSLGNFFYRVFCFFKEENLMFVAKKDQ